MNTGIAAHITAASPGGARYDASISSEDRRSPANAIWLCQTCAKLVDNDPDLYTVERLREWKQRAEEDTRAAIENRSPKTGMFADSVQVEFDGWELWRNRGNSPSDELIVVSPWAANAVRYRFTLRVRNRSQHEEQLRNLRMQTRSKDTVLFDDWHSIQRELILAPHKWVSHQINHGFNRDNLKHYEQADSIWFVASIVGTKEEIALKVSDLDHG